MACDLVQDRLSFDNDSIIIIGYMEPAIEGATLTFDCPPQYVLAGPNTTRCMGNGEWEPESAKVGCKGIDFIIIFQCNLGIKHKL